ncbi:MAG: ATP-binding protein [Thermodesulfovibrionales bacterium]
MSFKDNKTEKALTDCLCSKEPLSDDKCDFIVNYRGETTYIDYKESFDPNEQREWLNIIRDILAFANTCGGYIVFGVRDKTFEKVGVEEKDWKQLVDPDSIHKRINAYIQPPLTSLTSKHLMIDGMNFIILHIPESLGNTHIVVKEGKFIDNNKKEVIRLRKGEIFVRRSGSSQLIEPIDLEGVINRRITFFKDSLLSKISRIVEAPLERDVLIIEKGQEEITAKGNKYILSNHPEAVPIKGVSMTETPATDDIEIASSIALFRKDNENLPGLNLLYRIYARRKELTLSRDFFGEIALISIYKDIPCFYWLQFLHRDNIIGLIEQAIKKESYFSKVICLKIAACLGNSYFNKYLAKCSDTRFENLRKKFLQNGANGLYFNCGTAKLTGAELESEALILTEKLVKASDAKGVDSIFDKEKLWTIDFRLYSKNIATIV